MASSKTKKTLTTSTKTPASGRKPEWAQGLRQLYDSVVEEPLPDSFAELLARFDDTSA